MIKFIVDQIKFICQVLSFLLIIIAISDIMHWRDVSWWKFMVYSASFFVCEITLKDWFKEIIKKAIKEEFDGRNKLQ